MFHYLLFPNFWMQILARQTHRVANHLYSRSQYWNCAGAASTILERPQEDSEVQRSGESLQALITGRKKLSHAIWWARYDLERGRLLSTQVAQGMVEFSGLCSNDQKRVEDFDYGKANKSLSALEARKSPVYRGTQVEAIESADI